MRRNRFGATCTGKENGDSEPGLGREEAGAAKPGLLACQEQQGPEGGRPGPEVHHRPTAWVEGPSGQNFGSSESHLNTVQRARGTQGLPVPAGGAWDSRQGCSAPAAPWTQSPACSLAPSQHLESSEPDQAGLSHSCLWPREEGRKFFGPDQPEDPEEGEAVTQRPPPLTSSFPGTDPHEKQGAPPTEHSPGAACTRRRGSPSWLPSPSALVPRGLALGIPLVS